MTKIEIKTLVRLIELDFASLQGLIPYQLKTLTQFDNIIIVEIEESINQSLVDTVVESIKGYIYQNLITAKIV